MGCMDVFVCLNDKWMNEKELEALFEGFDLFI
jgi:hypothetical protein